MRIRKCISGFEGGRRGNRDGGVGASPLYKVFEGGSGKGRGRGVSKLRYVAFYKLYATLER